MRSRLAHDAGEHDHRPAAQKQSRGIRVAADEPEEMGSPSEWIYLATAEAVDRSPATRLPFGISESAAVANDSARLTTEQPRQRGRPRGRLFPRAATLLAAALVVLTAVAPATAIKVPFRNCLPDSYTSNDPPLLQFVPMDAEATYFKVGDNHNLEFVVWGNVTGSRNRVDLPPPSDVYWSNDQETEGKIIRTPYPDRPRPLATTLWRRTSVLTFTPWDEYIDFCVNGLGRGRCPLSPVWTLDTSALRDVLPTINITHEFTSSYAFSSLSPTLTVIYGDDAATHIGCVTAVVTPSLGSLAPVIKFIPLLILILTGFAVVFAAIYSPWGSTDIFHWSSNYGRDADLLRLVTPGFSDCLQYMQFMVLAGGLSLNYPGFYQPIVSQVAWSALLFNQSFVSDSEPFLSVRDGMYYTDGEYGLHKLGQLVGIAKAEDVWAGMMVWLCVIIAAITIMTQAAFVFSWLYRTINGTAKEDLRDKNLPFTIGNVVRIVYNYFLLPIVSLSAFQLAVASGSRQYTVALAGITIALLVIFASWLLWFIIRTRPKSVLFDDLPTVLRYGPLYNTYSDHSATFALIPVVLTFFRGIAIGAVQASGIAQVVMLALSEVVQILTLHAFRPFHPSTSMNAYHTVFSGLRLITVMLMIAFAPPLAVAEGVKGWLGYSILLVHGLVLVLMFFLNTLQTIVEVVALMLGVGGDDERGLTRGGLSKIFGMRQLSRRPGPREGPSRASQLSTSAMLDAEDGSKTGYTMPSGRIRSESGASLGGIMAGVQQRSDSALDSIDLYSTHQRPLDSVSAHTPNTPGEASTFSFITAPNSAKTGQPTVPMEAVGPYYRPPRRRRETLNESLIQAENNPQAARDVKRLSQVIGPLGPPRDPADAGAEISRNGTPALNAAGNPVSFLPNRPDYSTREVDFYYGVRGPALNSDSPGRRLGTGPADPTGPVATASVWFRSMFGGKTKDKAKGFEVVRSARMPPAMARNAGFGDETPPEGIPVAMGVLRNGPIDSDDEDEPKVKPTTKAKEGLLTETGEPRGPGEDEPDSPVAERLPRGTVVPQVNEPYGGSGAGPEIPRKSSKRNSALIDTSGSTSPSRGPAPERHSHQSSGAPSLAHLPFERKGSQKSDYTMEFSLDATPNEAFQPGRDERPASFGIVSQHNTTRVDHDLGIMGSSAELVDERSNKSARSGRSGRSDV